jgi:DNA-3-methyladenine glycosylase I
MEWGVPVHDDRHLFEMLVLGGAQAGLSWLTILRKRENYRKALHSFDFRKIAAYSERDIRRLVADSGIVSNRRKIESVIRNARAVLEIREEFGTLDSFLWSYVDGVPLHNAWRYMSELPTKTEISDSMSRDLKRRGFNYLLCLYAGRRLGKRPYERLLQVRGSQKLTEWAATALTANRDNDA